MYKCRLKGKKVEIILVYKRLKLDSMWIYLIGLCFLDVSMLLLYLYFKVGRV